ncbi:MAG: CvpA family protein [Ruminiclostridium sp.]|nr:CvpA family protein [Ruminiclostridium sp.]
MTMTASLLFDLVVLILLAYFAVTGFRRGFILTLCSLLAVVVGLVGGWHCVTHLLPMLDPLLLPKAALLPTKAIAFLLGFLGTRLIWILLCHCLDLVAKLPVLHFLNKFFGCILNLVKGFLILLVSVWILYDLLGWIPAEVAAESYSLSILTLIPLLTLPIG